MATHTLDLQNVSQEIKLPTESLSVNVDFTSVIKDFTSQSLQPEIWRFKVYVLAFRIYSKKMIVRMINFDDRSEHWLKRNLKSTKREQKDFGTFLIENFYACLMFNI